MLELLVQRRRGADVIELAVHLGAQEALLLQFGQLLAILALAAAHDGRQQVKPRAFRQRQDAVGHLADGLAFDGKARGRRIGHADAGKQQAQIVVDFGDGAHGGARVLGRGLLFDRNRRRQTLDVIHIGLLHHLQELAGIGRQRFHIAALAFGIDGVERQARLAGTGKSGQHGQGVTRNLDVDILEIVLARAADGNVLQHQLGFPKDGLRLER